MPRGGSRGGRGGGSKRGGRGGARGGAKGDYASSGDLNDTGVAAASSNSSSRVRAADSHAAERHALQRDDMYDEVDQFMEDRHRIPLAGRGGDNDSEDEGSGAQRSRGRKGKQRSNANTFELEGLEKDEEEEDEDEDEEAATAPGYFDVEAAEAKAARARELQAEANISTGWGKNRGVYHGADTVDYEIESDEDIALGEEEEGRRLQAEQAATLAQQVDEIDDLMAQVAEADAAGTAEASGEAAGKSTKKKGGKEQRSDAELLQDLDAELDGIDMALDLDLDIAALTQPSASTTGKGSKKQNAASASTMLVERISKDLSHVSESEKLELLLTSSPELLSLLDDFKANMQELKNLLPIWEEMKDEPDEHDKAWYCFVSMKVSTLLLYCCHVSFYLSQKASGRASATQLQSHPLMKTLLQLKKQLQGLQEMEEHFARMEEEQEEEEGEEAEGEEAEAGEKDEDADLDELEQGDEEELEDDDDEQDADLDALGGAEDDEEDDADGLSDEDAEPELDPSNLAKSDLMARQTAQLERLLAGVAQQPPKGKFVAAARKGKSASAAASARLSDFGEVDHRLELSRNITIGKASGKLAALQAKVKQAQQQEEEEKEKKKGGTKRKHQAEDEDESGGWGSKPSSGKKDSAAAASPEQDAGADMYAAARAAKQARKAERAALYAPKLVLAQSDGLSEEARRAASKQIKANRGLVRSRRKDKKNPKTANRLRFEKKLVARNGQVQLYKGSEAANYGGQATGIKTALTKSISLG